MPRDVEHRRADLLAVNGACDRASDRYRKLMLALFDYPRPPRVAGVHVTAYG